MNLRTFVAAMVAVGALARSAHADVALDQAKAKFDAAQAAYMTKDYAQAAQSFLDAYALRGDIPVMLFNAAVAFEEDAKANNVVASYEEAIKYYTQYVGTATSDPNNAATTARVTTLTTELANLRANPPAAGTAPSAAVTSLGQAAVIRGVYVIESTPSNAEIFLNGSKTAMGHTPWSGVLTGKPMIVLKLEGFIPSTDILPTSPTGLVVKSINLAKMDNKAYLTVGSNVAGANISVVKDGKVVQNGTTPTMLTIPGGTYTITVSADGYDEIAREVTLVDGTTPEEEFTLKGAPVGYLNMRGDGIEESKVYIDGELACDPGPCRKPLREGSHTIRVTRPDHKPYERTLEINPKTETQVKMEMAKKPSRLDAILTYGLAAAFAGGGVYLGLQAQKLEDELAADIAAGNPPVDANDPRFNRGKIYAIAADAAYGVAALSFLTAVYYTFRDKGPASRGIVDTKSIALSPAIGSQYAGVDMAVSW